MRISSKLLDKGAEEPSGLPCCNSTFQPDGGKQACFIFNEWLHQAAEGVGFANTLKLPSPRKTRDASSHLLGDQGKGTTGERQCPDSCVHHCRCLGGLWDMLSPIQTLSNQEWNAVCFCGTGMMLPKKH